MTFQLPDLFNLDGDELCLIALSAGLPFDPSAHGLRLRFSSSACWRGHIITYGLEGVHLVVRQLRVNLEPGPDGHPPLEALSVRGRVPIFERGPFQGFSHLYADMGLSLDYTGGLLISRDWVGGPHEALLPHVLRYREVHELVFDGGHLVERVDLSERLTDIRVSIARQARACGRAPWDPVDPRDVRRWMSESFIEDYQLERYFRR